MKLYFFYTAFVVNVNLNYERQLKKLELKYKSNIKKGCFEMTFTEDVKMVYRRSFYFLQLIACVASLVYH